MLYHLWCEYKTYCCFVHSPSVNENNYFVQEINASKLIEHKFPTFLLHTHFHSAVVILFPEVSSTFKGHISHSVLIGAKLPAMAEIIPAIATHFSHSLFYTNKVCVAIRQNIRSTKLDYCLDMQKAVYNGSIVVLPARRHMYPNTYKLHTLRILIVII